MKYQLKSINQFIEESTQIASKIQGILRDKYKDVIEKLFIFEKGDSLELNLIRIHSEKRNSGFATSIVEELIEYADTNNKIITLSPSKDFGADLNRLIKFYKGFGFIENKGKNRNSKYKDTLIKYPTRDSESRVI